MALLPRSEYGGSGDLINPSNGQHYQSPSETFGRVWNDFSGTSAKNEFTALEAEKARVFNSAEAQKNRDFQEYMSNTAYSRAIKDMKNAGLNPASLSGDGGASPASTPSGSTATAETAHSVNGSSSGGFIGLIARLAATAIGSSLAKKFTNTAETAAKSGSAQKVVRMTADQFNSAKQALLQKEAKRIEREHDRALGIFPYTLKLF